MNPATLNLNALAQMVSGQIGNSLAGGTIILVFAGLFSYLLRGEASGARFAVWFSGLVAIGGIPLAAIIFSRAGEQSSSALQTGTATITLPGSWAMYLFSAWSVIACIALARIVAGFWQVCTLRRRSAVLDARDLAPELQEILVRFRPARAVAVLLSDEIQSPTAIGLLSPVIVLPKWLLEELSTAELRQVLLHELAHLRRWDDWSNLLQKIVKALFFFHPAVWWMERRVSLEREMACDEAVLAQTDNPRAYAQCLVLLAEKSFLRRSVMLAQAAVSRVGQTSLRVARILRTGRPRTTGPWKLIAPSFAVALVVCLASLTRMPRLIAFTSNEPGLLAAQVGPQLAGAVRLAVNDSAVGNVSGKRLTKISSGSARPQIVAASRSCTVMPLRRDGPGSAVVQARFDFGENGLNAMTVQEAPVSEVVVVFVESRQNGSIVQAVWQIQMWHFTVLQTSKNPVPQGTPQKVI